MKSSRIRTILVGFSGVALLCAVPAIAQTGTNGSGQGGTASAMDKKFVTEATEGSNAEIALGNLAQQKSNSDDVKQFGQRMVQDHTQLNQQMQPVAQQIGVNVSQDQLSPKDQALQSKLQGLSGDQFDRAYIRAMVMDHRHDLQQFRHEIATTKDSTIRDTAQQGEKVIAEHLHLAEQLAQAHHVSVGGTSNTGATP